MDYGFPAGGGIDYQPCRYGASKLLFRGPKRALEGGYVAVLGGTETYGRFLEQPYPARLEALVDRPVVNFGTVNAGVDVFLHDPTVLQACSRAAVTVLQVGGAQNMSNRYYSVHPRRNDRFLRASALLKALYEEVDFTEVNFTRHLLAELEETSAERFALVEEELRSAWVGRMRRLLGQIEGQRVLLWFAGHPPEEPSRDAAEGDDPLFVDRAMLEAVAPEAEALVEVVVSPKEREAGLRGMTFGEVDEPAVREMLGTLAHERVAERLDAAIAGLLD